MDARSPKVFISYSHDSPAHEERVLALADRLCDDGVDCTIDQYEQAPPEGWPVWMETQIEEADFVLMVCTETYHRRVRRKEKPGVGRGVLWESNIIYNLLYVDGTKNKKFIPVLFESGDSAHIPVPLQGYQYYRVDTDDGYEELYRRLTDQHHTRKPVIGKALRKLPPRKRKQRVSTSTEPLCKLINVPDLPPYFLPRDDDLNVLKAEVLAGLDKSVVDVEDMRSVVVCGGGGIGKTVLATALAHDPEVQRAFPDGVLWVRVSQNPNLIARQVQIAQALGDESPAFGNVQQGEACLRKLMEDKSALLILDDVWSVDHVEAFNTPGLRCRVVITARNAALINALLSVAEFPVEALSEAEALALLAEWAEQHVKSLPPEAHDLARECDNLPLALALVGAMVRSKPPEHWRIALRNLRRVNLKKIHQKASDPERLLLRAIQISVKALKPKDRERYLSLAVFPEDVFIPEAVLQTFWGDADDVQETLDRFIDLSLMQRNVDGRLTLHDLQFDYVRKEVGEKKLPALHQCLLDAYADSCSDDWYMGLNDGYFSQHLAYHLKNAKRAKDLRALLFNFNWLQARLDATDVATLIADYDLLPDDDDLCLVQDALRHSAQIVAQDKTQLAGQLVGRLLSQESPEIQGLIERAKRWYAAPWLRPLTSSLIPPTESRFPPLMGHTAWVNAIVLTADGQRAVSASHDHTLKVWDMRKGQYLRTLRGHNNWVNGVVLTADGHRVVSTSDDGTLRVWNMESGERLPDLAGHYGPVNAVALMANGWGAVSASDDQTLKVWDLSSRTILYTLTGHEAPVNAVVLIMDKQWAVSASDDGTLKIWDLRSEQYLRTLEGHDAPVNTVLLTADGQRVVSASDDHTLKVWSLRNWQCLHTLTGHSDWVRAVVLTADGKRVISASYDHTLKVWDLESGQELRTLIGHTAPVNAVAMTADERRVISASSDCTLKVWDLERDSVIASFRGEDELTACAIAPDGVTIIAGEQSGRMHFLRLEGCQRISVAD